VPELIESVFSRLETLLRYIVPGFVALFVIEVLFQGSSHSLLIGSQEYPPWSVIIAFSLIGILIYAIHQNLVVRITNLAIVYFHLKVDKFEKKSGPEELKVNRVIIDLDNERWIRRYSDDKRTAAVQAALNGWAAMLNLLYCTSYVMILIPIYVSVIYPDEVSKYWWHILVLGILLLIIALASDWRLVYRELKISPFYHSKKEEKNLTGV
jgi:hypothetical protein